MFDIVVTLFSCGRTLIVCQFQEFPKAKESILSVIQNAHTAFLLSRADFQGWGGFSKGFTRKPSLDIVGVAALWGIPSICKPIN